MVKISRKLSFHSFQYWLKGKLKWFIGYWLPYGVKLDMHIVPSSSSRAVQKGRLDSKTMSDVRGLRVK